MQQVDPDIDVTEFCKAFDGAAHNYGWIYPTEISEELYRSVTYTSIWTFTAPVLNFKLRATTEWNPDQGLSKQAIKRRTVATATPYDFHGLVEPQVDWDLYTTFEASMLNDAAYSDKIFEEDIKFTGKAKVFNSSILSTRPAKKRLLPECSYTEESPVLEDPVFEEIKQQKSKSALRVFTTAKALAAISVVNRSVCPFELVFKKEGNDLFIYTRANESAAVCENTLETVTIPVNQRRDDTRDEFLKGLVESCNIASQFVAAANSGDGPTFTLGEDLDHAGDDDPTRPYVYRRFILKEIEFIIRCEIDCLRDPVKEGERPSLAICRTFNNFPTQLRSTNWDKDLEKARSSLLLAEIKDNCNSFAKWVAIGRLMQCNQIFIAFVERKNPANRNTHVVCAAERQNYSRGASIITLSEQSMMGMIYMVFQKMVSAQDGIYHFQRDPVHRCAKIFHDPKAKSRISETMN